MRRRITLSNLLMQELELFIILIFLVSTVVGKRSEACKEVEIVSREGWKARPPTRQWNMATPVNHVIISHTVSPQCFNQLSCMRYVQGAQDYHMDEQGWWDIGYNFVVGGDGRIYEGRGWTHTGAHAINFNFNSIGVSFVGDYRTDIPTEQMINATKKLIDCGVQKGYLTPSREIHGHRDVACTESPGENLYKVIRQWKNYKGGRMPNYNCAKS